jgi:hypothetical protein
MTCQPDETKQREGGIAEANAEFYISSWIDFGEEQGIILIAPVFNQEDFSSHLMPYTEEGLISQCLILRIELPVS